MTRTGMALSLFAEMRVRMVSFDKLLGALLMVALLNGCGGGGGAEGKASVTVNAPVQDKISGLKGIGQSLPNIDFSGTISGDVSALSGQPVFVIVEDASGLFSASPMLSLSSNGTSYHFVLPGKALTTPGHFTGTIRIYVCLERTCAAPLKGTPIAIPYDVTVEPQITLDRTEVTVSVPFGTVPTRETVGVTYSKAFAGWYVGRTEVIAPSAEQHIVIVRESLNMLSTGSQFQLELIPSTPGVYRDAIRVNTSGVYPPNTISDATVNVTYTVTANPDLDFVFYPATAVFTQPQSVYPVARSFSIVPNTDVTTSLVGIEYLSAAGTAGPATSWLSLTGTATCYNNVSVETCLAPGLYTAQIRYRVTSKGVGRDVLYPVSLTVTN